MEAFERSLEAVGMLAEGLRRRMFQFIRAQRRPVSRDEAAAAVGISRKLAAFHLDKLVEVGLLKAHYSRLSGRAGPGAGRPSKVYEPADVQLSVSIPSRSYDFAAGILLSAVAGSSTTSRDEVRAAAREQGVRLGRQIRDERRPRSLSRKKAIAVACEALYDRGYEPYKDDGGSFRLANCPFHVLAQQSVEIVCGLNHAFIEGLLSGLDAEGLSAILDPRPGECCVRVAARDSVA
ncbi:MAG TPA: helix-turn-helix domain-containing protein [Actinomycetota bacterium]|jgi:predicted ArsR family transcriptional regulator|nr:helix-turn-helix domain-containing protein [Actinomycetota bacterium]